MFMTEYEKPVAEYIEFSSESITDGVGDFGGGNTSSNIDDFG